MMTKLFWELIIIKNRQLEAMALSTLKNYIINVQIVPLGDATLKSFHVGGNRVSTDPNVVTSLIFKDVDKGRKIATGEHTLQISIHHDGGPMMKDGHPVVVHCKITRIPDEDHRIVVVSVDVDNLVAQQVLSVGQ